MVGRVRSEDDHRTSQSREFFRIDPDKAIIEMVAIEVETLSDQQQHITPEDRAAIETVKARAEATTFERLGLSPGAVLTFTKDPTVTCTVAGARKVQFRGQELSLSAAALQALREMGFDWITIRGPEY